MRWYRYVLQPLSGVVTPWRADTLIGHFAWDIIHREGEAALKDFLSAFEAGRPPFVLTDGFPGDLLPAPLSLPWLYGAPDAARRAAGHKWLTLEEFNQVRAGLAPTGLHQAPRREAWQTALTPHVRLSRRTLTAGEQGSLYALEEHLPDAPERQSRCVTFYALVEDEPAAARLEDLFCRLSQSGYGRKKSSGKGAFRLAQAGAFDGFSQAEGYAVVSLANLVPAAADPTEGLWQMAVKFGRLGEERALWPQPFKRPYRFLTAGAVFRGAGGRSWLGRCLCGLSSNPDNPGQPGDDLQVCLAPVLPCVWPPAVSRLIGET